MTRRQAHILRVLVDGGRLERPICYFQSLHPLFDHNRHHIRNVRENTLAEMRKLGLIDRDLRPTDKAVEAMKVEAA